MRVGPQLHEVAPRRRVVAPNIDLLVPRGVIPREERHDQHILLPLHLAANPQRPRAHAQIVAQTEDAIQLLQRVTPRSRAHPLRLHVSRRDPHIVVAWREHHLSEAVLEHAEGRAQHVLFVAHVARTEAHVKGALPALGQVGAKPLHVGHVVAMNVRDDKDPNFSPSHAVWPTKIDAIDPCGWWMLALSRRLAGRCGSGHFRPIDDAALTHRLPKRVDNQLSLAEWKF
mmetsp:Transcript_25420/g.74440  ORF Transcript_25420/g.74440 Transcript_25420/m.74440 type:complete len:228 (-) Transcript_25420:184-867(-)